MGIFDLDGQMKRYQVSLETVWISRAFKSSLGNSGAHLYEHQYYQGAF